VLQCGRTGHLWRGCPRGPAKETVDRSDWRRECATGGRSEARRQMTESARTPPCLTHQSDEKQRLDACVAALERQNEELKAKVAELEAVLERKAEATTEAPKEEGSEAECQRRVTCRRVRIVAVAAPDDRERAAPRRGQLTSDRVEARQNRRSDSTGVSGGDRVWPYRPARDRKVTKASLGSTAWSTRSSGTLERR
jgi:predicted RNase H-like nuclease (RuvC/YqgF family)